MRPKSGSKGAWETAPLLPLTNGYARDEHHRVIWHEICNLNCHSVAASRAAAQQQATSTSISNGNLQKPRLPASLGLARATAARKQSNSRQQSRQHASSSRLLARSGRESRQHSKHAHAMTTRVARCTRFMHCPPMMLPQAPTRLWEATMGGACRAESYPNARENWQHVWLGFVTPHAP